MSRTHIALALAVSFGVTKPTLSPIKEVPLSKSDILVAGNTSDQGPAKMGKGSALDNPNGQAVNEAGKSDKMNGSTPK